MEAMRKKAMMLAEMDFNVNGSYINSPYKMEHLGEHLKVFVRNTPKGEKYLEIVRPQQTITTTGDLPSNTLNLKEDVG